MTATGPSRHRTAGSDAAVSPPGRASAAGPAGGGVTGRHRDPVGRWQVRLAERVGMGVAERAALRDELEEFCAARGIAPARLLTEWTEHREPAAARPDASADPPHRAVRSFLIHNGVDVSGDLAGGAGRPEGDAAPGSRPAGG